MDKVLELRVFHHYPSHGPFIKVSKPVPQTVPPYRCQKGQALDRMCPSQIHTFKANPQCDNIWRWGLPEYLEMGVTQSFGR